MEHSGNSSSFKDAARRLSAAFAADGDSPYEEDREQVRSALLMVLFIRFSSLGAAEICEVADETVKRLLEESRRQGRSLDNASAWLRRVAINLALDHLKRVREEPLEDENVEDELSTRLLERLESDDQVKRGLAIAIEKRDEVVVQVVTAYLDLADEEPGFPSSRAVADRCGRSHTTVQETLKRFRGYIE
jgi:DNA-directed RNA polymerase specialized sigma24 family protein